MKRTPEEDRATATHEARHAVTGRVLGFLCDHVTIQPNHRTRTADYGAVADPFAETREAAAAALALASSCVLLGLSHRHAVHGRSRIQI